MRLSALLGSLLLCAATGCTMIALNGAPDPEERLEAGLNALAERDLTRAQEHLQWVYYNHPDSPEGRQALLVLIAAELDPRNPARRLWAGADLAARLLNAEESPGWVEPLAETLYLLSLELGANEERIARAEAQRDSAEALPRLPGPSFLAQLQTTRAERDSLKRRTTNLEQALATRDRELKEKDQELERIRKTLKGG